MQQAGHDHPWYSNKIQSSNVTDKSPNLTHTAYLSHTGNYKIVHLILKLYSNHKLELRTKNDLLIDWHSSIAEMVLRNIHLHSYPFGED